VGDARLARTLTIFRPPEPEGSQLRGADRSGEWKPDEHDYTWAKPAHAWSSSGRFQSAKASSLRRAPSVNVLEEREATVATIKDYLIVRSESGREVRRSVKHYNLNMILAVGYRVRSDRGVAFRQWATARLSDYRSRASSWTTSA